ncbi:MAG: DUF3305 domain-containing protein [Nitratireductor sp.]
MKKTDKIDNSQQIARTLSIPVGVLAEKRKPQSKWADEYWIPVGIMPAGAGHKPGDVLVRDDTFTRYYLGEAEIFCHATQTEALVHNFESVSPAIYVILRRDVEDQHELPWFVHMVTASPYEALDNQDSAEDICERVPMPSTLARAIMDFIDAHHVHQPFRKRKRVDAPVDEVKFGKEPIFMDRFRPAGGKLDG